MNRLIKHDGNQINRKADTFDFGKLLSLFLNYWYYFLICVFAAVVIANFYIQIALPMYRVSTTLLIEEDGNTSVLGPENILQGIGLRPGAQNLENQIDILSSRATIRRVLGELPFEIDCYRKRFFRKASYYPLEPFEIVPHYNEILTYNQEYSVELLDNERFILSEWSNAFMKKDTTVSFGQKINFNWNSFTVLPNPGVLNLLDSQQKVFFILYDLNTLTEEYRSRLEIEIISNGGSIIRLTLKGTNTTKDKIFLDKLTEVYNRSQIEKKNSEANRIIDFIDSQLIDVSDSLLLTENQLQTFRSENRIMDISIQAQQVIEQAFTHENTRAMLSLESNYYEYLSEYLDEENNREVLIAPVSMGISDPLLASLIQELAGLQSEYFSTEKGKRNPMQIQLEIRIENTKESLRETLLGIQHANRLAIAENDEQIRKINKEASVLPEKERRLLGIERKFNLNNVLYTFLLQRRSEAQIQKASNTSDVEVIDKATADLFPVSPKSQLLYLLSVFIGIGFPLIVILLWESCQNKIQSEEDLKMITELPLVGHIPHSRLSYNTVVLNEPHSKVAEAFRSLRTRMEFFTREAKCPIILVSSTMPGEGKTFTSINLASAYSLAAKKTLLVGFDLRRPNLNSSFEFDENVGLSTYLIGKSSYEDIVFNTEYPNLSIMPSGPIPPNPGELATSDKLGPLFNKLKDIFDYIIIDSAPVGSVSDSYTAASLSDAIIIIVRHNKTIGPFLRATLLDSQAHDLKGLSLLINDFKPRRKSSRYNYNYKFQYYPK